MRTTATSRDSVFDIMLELKLVDPVKRKATKLEKTIRTAGFVDAIISLGIIYSVTEAGFQISKSAQQYLNPYGKLQLTDKELILSNDDEHQVIPFENIDHLEFYFYDGNNVNLEDKYAGTSLLIFTGTDKFACQTKAGKRICRKMLDVFYQHGVNLKEYKNDSRSYRLKTMMYAEIEELKEKYGPDFW